MPSSKKARGKQRKAVAAARREAAVQRNEAPAPPAVPPSHVAGRAVTHNDDPLLSSAHFVLRKIRQGNQKSVDIVRDLLEKNFGGRAHNAADLLQYLQYFVDVGLVEAVLPFFNQCKKFPIPDVIGETEDPVVDPSRWIMLLVRITARDGLPTTEGLDRCRLEVAYGIGPLVRCMSSSSRTFFKSREHWNSSIGPFMHLIHNISRAGNCTAEILFKQKGLVGLLVHSMFWKTHRPDIVGEIERHCHRTGAISVRAECVIALCRNLLTEGRQSLRGGHRRGVDAV